MADPQSSEPISRSETERGEAVARLSFTAYGRRIGIESNEPALLDRALPLLPHGWKAAPRAPVEHLYSLRVGTDILLEANGERLSRSADADTVLDALQRDLRLFVAEFARRRVFVHAGVVGWNGRAAVIPGRSFTGKTALVAELVRAGAAYYSDEFAVFDARGRVHPFLKPLSIRESGGYLQADRPVAELGGVAGRKPLPVGLVIITEYRPGVDWRPERLSPGQGALALLANAVAARRAPERILRTLQAAAGAARTVRSLRGEGADVAELVLSLLDMPDERAEP